MVMKMGVFPGALSQRLVETNHRFAQQNLLVALLGPMGMELDEKPVGASRHLHPGAKEVEAVYGLAFHPDFEKNRRCFVCYTLKGSDNRPNLKDGTRVSRFLVTRSDPPRIEPASEEIVLTYPQEHLLMRLGLRAINLWLRVSGCSFRTYVHPITRILGAAEAHGLRLERRERQGFLWESAALVR